MKIIKATQNEKDLVLSLLDDFRSYVFKLNGVNTVSDTARTLGVDLFDKIIELENYAVFIATEGDNEGVGIITINKSIVLRKGSNKAEVEEFFVKEGSQNNGVGSKLLEKAEQWAKDKNCSYMELISGNELAQAHKFYEAKGFKFYGKGAKKDLV